MAEKAEEGAGSGDMGGGDEAGVGKKRARRKSCQGARGRRDRKSRPWVNHVDGGGRRVGNTRERMGGNRASVRARRQANGEQKPSAACPCLFACQQLYVTEGQRADYVQLQNIHHAGFLLPLNPPPQFVETEPLLLLVSS